MSTFTNFFSDQQKIKYDIGGDPLVVAVKVAGRHDSKLSEDEGSTPKSPFIDILPFPRSNVALPINVYAGFEGTISFFIRLRYAYYKSGLAKVIALGSDIPFAFGEKTYEMSFDYALPLMAADATDLIIQQGVGGPVGEPEVEGDEHYTIELNQWNSDTGMAKGPNYVRINPSVVFSQAGKSVTLNAGFDLGFDAQYASSSSISPPQPSPQNGVAKGGFKIPIHAQLFAPPKPDKLKPPQSFIDDMSVTLYYKNEGDFAFTRDMEATLLAWVSKINSKYPAGVAIELRKGSLPIYVDGYASITSSPSNNQNISDKRLAPVVQYLAKQLAVPAGRITGKPYGSQMAKAQWNFDTKGSAVPGPRDEDRAVGGSLDRRERCLGSSHGRRKIVLAECHPCSMGVGLRPNCAGTVEVSGEAEQRSAAGWTGGEV